MTPSVMANMTWEMFRDAVDNETVAVIPMGSTELEGPHLPLGVDTIAADAVAATLKGEPGVLITPTLPVGYSKWFKPFAGTISLTHGTLSKVLAEYAGSLIDDGIRRIVFLNAHRGNNACIEAVSRDLIMEHGLVAGMLSIWKLANDLTAGRTGMIREGKFTHAGEIMTSLIMAAAPETVVTEKIAAGALKSPERTEFTVHNSLGETRFRESVQTLYQDIRMITDNGVFGDPSAATPEKGNAICQMIGDYARAFLREFRKVPLPSPGETQTAGTTEARTEEKRG